MRATVRWAPAVVMALGALGTLGTDLQEPLPLRRPLGEAIPLTIAGREGTDLTIPDDELAVAAPTAYLLRQYAPAEGDAGFSVYVGYYAEQARGQTIHSPKNCLPGGGWEALASESVPLTTALGTVVVNRYLIQRGDQMAVVLYWYQGRGRVQANEYRVKWDLLRDAALRQRSDEALVRIVVPVHASREGAQALARTAAVTVVEAGATALPE